MTIKELTDKGLSVEQAASAILISMTRRSIGETKAIGTSIGPTNETLKKLLASAKEKDAVAKAEAVRKCKAALIEKYAYSPYELYKARRFDEKSHPIDGVATYYSILAAAESMGKSVTEGFLQSRRTTILFVLENAANRRSRPFCFACRSRNGIQQKIQL